MNVLDDWESGEARELILNNGINRYKKRNSKIVRMDHKEDKNKKGSIFAFRSKEAMQESRGIVVTSLGRLTFSVGVAMPIVAAIM